ncbi:hypothetical protein DFH08DRAFT_867632 [Mycena albidolilacea]|uniref:Uncharacterized protein n=1 Tax=Mycena albidolilacea TaxID=1033008 RepID=A0AAD7A1S9_9AGAR|nr:hypothetical protein DFH08DRAFT_867632 [Mycena albidolilacea]
MQLSIFHRLLLSTLLSIPAAKAWGVVLENNCGFGTATIVHNGVIIAVAQGNRTDAVAFITPTTFPVVIQGFLQTEPCCANDLTKVYNTSISSVLEPSVTSTQIELKGPIDNSAPFIQVSTVYFIACPTTGSICASPTNCNLAAVSCPGQADIGATFCKDTI